MLVKEFIRGRNKCFVPPAIPGFVATDQKDRTTAQVKCEQHSIRSPCMLYPKFFHIAMTGRVDEVSVRPGKAGANLLKQDDLGVYTCLFGLGQTFPPIKELVRKLDLPFHGWNIVQRLYFVKVTITAVSWPQPRHCGQGAGPLGADCTDKQGRCDFSQPWGI
jgi:hypothetical protein